MLEPVNNLHISPSSGLNRSTYTSPSHSRRHLGPLSLSPFVDNISSASLLSHPTDGRRQCDSLKETVIGE